jgi:hypothetical protein
MRFGLGVSRNCGHSKYRMRLPFRLSPRAWLFAPACAFAFVAWSDYVRIERVEFVSKVAGEEARVDASSPTGYADGKRWLIVPEHNNPSYQWIEETQLMLSRGDWRVRHVDYENAPFGREVHTASPYRWWLVLVAWCDHKVSGRPLGLSVERAALYADPLLHLLLLVTATIFVAWQFGGGAAALLSLGLAAMFPLAAAYLPGIANDFGLSQVAAFWSVLLLIAGTASARRATRWYLGAGVAGGFGLWLDASAQVPVIVGIALGALLAAVSVRIRPGALPDQSPAVPPWRAWAFGGAIMSLLGYLIEYFPGHMGPQLRVNYPLYGLAWLGLGELLWRSARRMDRRKQFRNVRDADIWVLSAAAVASLPIAILRSGNHDFLSGNLLSTRLSNLPDGVVADSISAWIAQSGITGTLAATFLPLLLLGPAAWILVGKAADPAHRAAVAIAVGPVLAAAAHAVHQLRWWNTLDCALLVLLVAEAAAVPVAAARRPRWLLCGLLVPSLVFGIVSIAPTAGSGGENDFKFTRPEVEGLYERALAQWIADRAGPDGATVLVPPFRTSSFCFYGSLRGIGTQNWENRDGLSAAFRIVNSTRPDETLALINQHGVTHIVVPAWDTDFDNFARMGLKQPKDSFIYALHQTDGGIFSWLRALPYSQPEISGFKEQSVLVLAVTDETDPATQRGRLVEYLVEMHQLDAAAYSSQSLLRYPADLGALVALAQVQKARGDAGGFDRVFSSLISNLSSGSDRSLAWDRRVSLAVVLALGRRNDLARDQVKRCLADIDASKIRSLTSGSLYHLLVLDKGYGLEIADPKLRELSMKLLPSELRERL